MSVSRRKTLTLPLLNAMGAGRLLKIIWMLLIVLSGVFHLVEVFQGKMCKYLGAFYFFASLHRMSFLSLNL